MSRTKGSKNKKKRIKKEEIMNDTQGGPEEKQEEKAVEEVDNSRNCVTCGHEESKHYGGDERNCNVMNCLCMAYKLK